MKSIDIATKLRALCVTRTSDTDEAIIVSSWYENTDGTITRYDWVNGRLKEGDTLPGWSHYPAYLKLSKEWCDAIAVECGFQESTL